MFGSAGPFDQVSVAGVTIMAPTNLDLRAANFTSGPSAYNVTPFGGTSGATAVIGGASGLVLEMLLTNGITPNYLVMNAMIALMGDGANSATTKTRTVVDDEYGYGRFKMQLPVATANDVGEIHASRLVVASGTLNGGQAAYFGLNCYYGCATAATGIKAVVYGEDPNRNSAYVPNFKLEIVDLCDSYSVIKTAATTPYLWKRIRVYDEWRFDNRCPAMRVTLDDTTGFQNVRFAAAAYMFGPENPFWEYH